MRISIRAVILSLYVFSQASMAQESVDERKHGLSLFGTPALEKGFSHFPYVNTTAPKGGNVRIAAIGSFDSLNSFTIKGNYA